MKNVVYILGNENVEKDSLPLKFAQKLKKKLHHISFVHLDPTEELTVNGKKDLVFIDTVLGIDKVTVFDTLDCFSASPRCTVHDFDLFVNLKLMQKIGKVGKITIIGIPNKKTGEKIIKNVEIILKSISPSENERHNSCKGQKHE